MYAYPIERRHSERRYGRMDVVRNCATPTPIVIQRRVLHEHGTTATYLRCGKKLGRLAP